MHSDYKNTARLAQHFGAIEMFYLQSYGPELNPNEMGNADLKQSMTTSKTPAPTKVKLIKLASSDLRGVQK